MSSNLPQQQITPDLRRWIVEQSQAGQPAEAVLTAMKASGWTESVALSALETTLRSHRDAAEAASGLPPASAVPEPDLKDSPLYLDAGDRRVHVIQTLERPRVVVFGGLLSDQECEELMALARPRMSRSLTVATQTGGEEVHADRTSDGMFFQRAENELVSRIEARLARLLHWPQENGEGIQILRYRAGAQYKPHYDYFDPDEPGTPSILRRGGQRVGTVVMYLGEPEKGGATTFPDARLEVAPKRGHAVFFSYDRPHPSTLTLHGGAPVIAGEKWIATKWMREHHFG